MSFLKKSLKFIRDVVVVAATKVKNFFVGVYQHAESITVLTLASMGLSALIGELPFWLTLPMWIEAPLVIPFISVTIIWLIMKFAEWRSNRRARKLTLVMA
jgi:hypothetical protein